MNSGITRVYAAQSILDDKEPSSPFSRTQHRWYFELLSSYGTTCISSNAVGLSAHYASPSVKVRRFYGSYLKAIQYCLSAER